MALSLICLILILQMFKFGSGLGSGQPTCHFDIPVETYGNWGNALLHLKKKAVSSPPCRQPRAMNTYTYVHIHIGYQKNLALKKRRGAINHPSSSLFSIYFRCLVGISLLLSKWKMLFWPKPMQPVTSLKDFPFFFQPSTSPKTPSIETTKDVEVMSCLNNF